MGDHTEAGIYIATMIQTNTRVTCRYILQHMHVPIQNTDREKKKKKLISNGTQLR
uniref:Uncharacterized protein n=1 Tax=Rhizophora mucronata TaxID=61149 RepID=A0A2P2KU95_RHIMU